MKISLAFLRVFFMMLSILFMTAFMISLPMSIPFWQKGLIGLGMGALFSVLLLCAEALFKRYHLRAFNTVVLGLFLGYLMGKALVAIFGVILDLTHMKIALQPQTIGLIKVCAFLMGTYLGTFLTVRFCDEILISIPFIRLTQSNRRKKDLLLDSSALLDPRVLDLASTGLLDHALVMPRFLEKELYSQIEMGQDAEKTKSRKCIETLKKLKENPSLGLRYDETPLNHLESSLSKLLRLARINEANILSSELSQTQIPTAEGVRIVNLHHLSNTVKPLMDAGEVLQIKIQRLGKEANQGVGYLEDGTMVVVNGGGDFIGETIEVQVLSVKHISSGPSGRMIFCNTIDAVSPQRSDRVEV